MYPRRNYPHLSTDEETVVDGNSAIYKHSKYALEDLSTMFP